MIHQKIKRGENHFHRWYAAHKPDIDKLWRDFNTSMEEYIKEPVRYNYIEFVDFMYWHSSGIIN